MKVKLKEKAIIYRKNGLSYTEILKIVPVAKSTLSLWFKSVNLSKSQKQRLTQKKLLASIRGGEAKRKHRQEITKQIISKSILEIDKISEKELKLIGSVLYWAEGSKSKEYNPSTGVIFGNSDPLMCKLFVKWLIEILSVPVRNIKFSVYIHESHKKRINEIRTYWAKVTKLSESRFDKIYFKRNKLGTKRRNVGNNYYGLLRIVVKRSTNMSRKIQGWIEGICIQCGVV